MLIALTILKAIVILGGMGYLFAKIFQSKMKNKLWFAFKTIGVIFLTLLLITVVEFIILGII